MNLLGFLPQSSRRMATIERNHITGNPRTSESPDNLSGSNWIEISCSLQVALNPQHHLVLVKFLFLHNYCTPNPWQDEICRSILLLLELVGGRNLLIQAFPQILQEREMSMLRRHAYLGLLSNVGRMD